jgi:hypothetical protein
LKCHTRRVIAFRERAAREKAVSFEMANNFIVHAAADGLLITDRARASLLARFHAQGLCVDGFGCLVPWQVNRR